MAVGELAVLVLELDVLCFSKVGAEIMRGAGLESLAVLHHGFDGIGVVSTGEAFIGGLFSSDHGHGENVL